MAVLIAAAAAPYPPRPAVARAFIINLDRSKDRRVHMEQGLANLPGAVQRVAAATYDDLHRAPYAAFVERQGLDANLNQLRSKTTRKVAATWLSHVVLWERLQPTGPVASARGRRPGRARQHSADVSTAHARARVAPKSELLRLPVPHDLTPLSAPQ